ncbi:MAG: MFS transporter [Chloroflexi bacterium]|nr:MFS transporter [Chloroflexota bacterium]
MRHPRSSISSREVSLGLRANRVQFAFLVTVNLFVGGMVGLERSVLPILAESEFGILSSTAAVSFIATFGISKALTNLFAGDLSQRFSRKSVLVAGWLFGLPVPFMIILAPSWSWVIAANVLLGVNQGLAWSMTVNMKIDLAGPRRRGLALGLNEMAGYVAAAAAAYLTGVIAQHYGLRPEPFYLGIALAALGLGFSVLFVRDTKRFVELESATHPLQLAKPPTFRQGFADTTWRKPYLFGITQAGLVKNLNDGLAWGIFPLYFSANGLDLGRVAALAAIYPMVWGVLQLGTGWISDMAGRKLLIVSGMLLQGLAISAVGLFSEFVGWVIAMSVLGIGTAMVYPTLLAAISDSVSPGERATSIGVFRFWRDSGIFIGALVGGGIADIFSFGASIQVVAAVTVGSGVLAAATIRRDPNLQTLASDSNKT